MDILRWPPRIRPGTLLVVIGLTTALIVASGDARLVVAPVAATMLCIWWFYSGLERRGDSAPLGDVGAWYVAIVSLYAIIPVLVYIALGMQYTPLNDNRAFGLQPPPPEIARIAWMHAVHLVVFSAVYIATYGKRLPPPPRVASVPPGVLVVSLVALFAGSFITVIFTAGSGGPATYAEGYARIAALPLVVRQFLRLYNGIEFALTLIVFVALFERYERYRWLIWGYLAFRILTVTTFVGSRTELFVPLLISLVLYHLQVRPIRRRTAITLAIIALSGFMALGVLRAFQAIVSGSFTMGTTGGEFEALFTNAIDIDMKSQQGQIGPIPLSFLVADLFAPIPSQMLPFEKVDLSVWYLQTFYPGAIESGGGLAFGIIPQSIIGFGWIDLVMRSALLGFVFGRIHNYYRRHGSGFWVTVFYVWILLWSYQSFRNSTFALLPFVFQWLIPAILFVELSRALLLAGFGRGHRWRASASAPRPQPSS